MKASERRALNQKKKVENKPEVVKETPAIVVGVDPRHTDQRNEERSDQPIKEKLGPGKHKNPNSLKNLKPIKPGQVLNPKGWPKGKRHVDTLFDEGIKKLAEAILIVVNGKRKIKKLKPITLEESDIDPELDMWLKQLEKARNGDHKAFELIQAYRHGKPAQKVEFTGKDGDPIEYTVRVKEFEDSLIQEEDKWFDNGEEDDQK